MRHTPLAIAIAFPVLFSIQTFAADINIASGVTVAPGQSAPLPVSLTQPAACCGVFIQLASSDTSVLTVNPTSLFIPQGATQPALPPQVTGVSFGTATITASAFGLASASRSFTVGATLAFTPNSISLTQGGNEFVFVTLSSAAPVTQTFTLSVDKPGIVTLPPAVVFPANWTSAGFQVTALGAGSATVTVNAPAGITATSLSVNVMGLASINLPASENLSPGQSASLPVNLGSPAPPGGVTVTLSSSDSGKVSVSPSSVFVSAGLTAPASQPQVTAINIGAATITASAPGYGPGTSVAAVNATLTFIPQSITITQGVTQQVSLALSTAAPPGGFLADLKSDNPAVAQVQSTLGYFPDGSSQEINSLGITAVSAGTTRIHASALPFIPDTSILVTVVAPGVISLPTNLQVGVTQTLPFPVQLGSPAPPGGVSVNLQSSDSSTATISPSPVFIASGATTPAAQPQITGNQLGQVTITASAIGYAPANTTAFVIGAVPSAIAATGGTPQSALINSPFVVPLSSTVTDSKGNPVGGVTVTFRAPASGPSGTFAGGQGTVTATTDSKGVATSPIFTSNGIQGAYTVSALVTGVGQPAVFSLTNTIPTVGPIVLPANVVLAPGQSTSFAVSLGLPAPAGGLTISLLSSDTSKVTISPSVFIPEGATAAAVQPTISGVNFGSANISATANGLPAANQLVQVSGSMNFTPLNLTITGTSTQNLTLNLSSPAPSGLTIALASDNTAAATVGPTVTFATNATSVNVPVTGVAPGVAHITATSSTPSNLPGTSATATVKATADIILASGVTVGVGESAILTVTLAQPAPSFMFVNLTSSDPSKLTINLPNVVFFQGSTTPASQPSVTGVALGSATVTASGFNLTGDTETVQVLDKLALSPANASISQGSSQQMLLTLEAALGSAQTFTLTSDNTNVVTVPSSITLPANTTSISFSATSVKPGSTMIHATSANPSITPAAASITVAAVKTITLPSSITLTRNQSLPFPVLLGSPAPSGGVTVTLISSNPGIVSITPATVFIPEGATAPAVPPQVGGVELGSATVSASAPGYTGASQSVTVDALLTFSPPTLTMFANTSQIVMLGLSTASPPGGFFVSLTSDNPNVAYTQSFLGYFPDGSALESNQLLITAGSPGTTVIHASVSPLVPVEGTSITVTVLPAP